MAKTQTAFRDDGPGRGRGAAAFARDPARAAALAVALAVGFILLPAPLRAGQGAATVVAATPAGTAGTAGTAGAAARPMAAGSAASPTTIAVPRIDGRLAAAQLGLVINVDDPYSVAVGARYAQARGLAPAQVLRVALPVRPVLSAEAFEPLRAAVEAHFGADIQALALAWREPYAVQCNGITAALALGYDAALCRHPCAAPRPSPYFNARTARPYAELGIRPAMLLAAPDVAGAAALIARGLRADGTLGLRGAPPAHAWFLTTEDGPRNVRATLYPPPGPTARGGLELHVARGPSLRGATRVLLLQTGATHVEHLDTLDWVPGALADHVTSFGGQLDGAGGQMSALQWIAAGATASYGTVSEPCAHARKFPHPQVLLLHYLQGSTALEAYWKSVAWPQQGVFIGEPLAAPFAHPRPAPAAAPASR